MVEAINHDSGSSVGTVASSAAKWSLIGALVGGAAIFGGIAIGAGLIGTAFGGGFLAGAGYMFGGFPLVVSGIISVAAGGANMGLGALVGGLFGLAKGSERVSHEKAAYRTKVQGLTNSRAIQSTKIATDAEIRAMTQTYQELEPIIQQREDAAFQKGQEFVVHQLQEHAMQKQKAMMSADGQQVTAQATAEAKCVCGPHTEKVVNEKAVAMAMSGAQAGAQAGGISA